MPLRTKRTGLSTLPTTPTSATCLPKHRRSDTICITLKGHPTSRSIFFTNYWPMASPIGPVTTDSSKICRHPVRGFIRRLRWHSRDMVEIDFLRLATMQVDPYSLCDMLNRGIKGGSDGSVPYYTQGSFGWMLSSITGECVLQREWDLSTGSKAHIISRWRIRDVILSAVSWSASREYTAMIDSSQGKDWWPIAKVT